MDDSGPACPETIKKALEAEGFEVINMESLGFGDMPSKVSDIKDQYDLAMFVFNYPSASNNT